MNSEELLQTLDQLKKGYIASMSTLETMKNWGRVQLESLYATKIGQYKVELLELSIELKALKKKIQLCQQYINRNETPPFNEIEERVRQMSLNAYQEVHIEKQKIALGKHVLSNLYSPEESAEIRRIYRNVAKSLHPDLNPLLTERQMEMWHIFLAAYKEHDLDKLKALEIVYADDLRKSVEQVAEQPIDHLHLQIATLKQGIEEIEAKIAELDKEFPFNLADQIRDDEWVAEQQNLLKAQITEAQQAIAEKQGVYNLIREVYE